MGCLALAPPCCLMRLHATSYAHATAQNACRQHHSRQSIDTCMRRAVCMCRAHSLDHTGTDVCSSTLSRVLTVQRKVRKLRRLFNHIPYTALYDVSSTHNRTCAMSGRIRCRAGTFCVQTWHMCLIYKSSAKTQWPKKRATQGCALKTEAWQPLTCQWSECLIH